VSQSRGLADLLSIGPATRRPDVAPGLAPPTPPSIAPPSTWRSCGVARSHPPSSLEADGVLPRHTDSCFNRGPRARGTGPRLSFSGPSAPAKVVPAALSAKGRAEGTRRIVFRFRSHNAASELRTSKRHAHYRFADGLWSLLLCRHSAVLVCHSRLSQIRMQYRHPTGRTTVPTRWGREALFLSISIKGNEIPLCCDAVGDLGLQQVCRGAMDGSGRETIDGVRFPPGAPNRPISNSPSEPQSESEIADGTAP
jgi:hypothetical protein